MLELGHYARFTSKEENMAVTPSGGDRGGPKDDSHGIPPMVVKTIVRGNDVSRGRTRAIISDGRGRRVTTLNGR
jgi:hypothetical protein